MIGDKQQVHQDQQQEDPPASPSTVKRDGKGYAIPSTKTAENYYATVNFNQKKMSQRKKETGRGTGNNVETVRHPSPSPPLPPPIDPALVDDDIKCEPSVPLRSPLSEQLVEAHGKESPYAKVTKGKVDSQPSPATAEGDDVEPYAAVDIKVMRGGELNVQVTSGVDREYDTNGQPSPATAEGDDVEPYAAVDIKVMRGGELNVQVTSGVDREYDTIDNVMPPTRHAHVGVTLSEVEGEYASVRSDAVILPTCDHQGSDPGTQPVATTHYTNDDQTPTPDRATTTSPEKSEL